MKLAIAWSLLGAAAVSGCASQPSSSEVDGWAYYGHDAGGMRHSPLTQITRSNVSRLQVAWTVHTGDVSDGANGRQRSGFEKRVTGNGVTTTCAEWAGTPRCVPVNRRGGKFSPRPKFPGR